MTQDQIEIRIIRLEETVKGLIELKYLLQKVLGSAEKQLALTNELLESINELRMDIAKTEVRK